MKNFLLSRKQLLLAVVLLISASGFAQVRQEWVARYSSPGLQIDEARDIAVDSQGNVYVTGVSSSPEHDYDIVTIKYNTAGTQQWLVRYDGPANGTDWANAIAVDDAGNVYVSGYSDKQAYDADYVTIKYDAYGNELWVAYYDGTADEDSYDYLRDMVVDKEGNVYVTGASRGEGTDFDYLTIKYNTAGELQWLNRYDGPASSVDDASAIAVDAAGNVYVTGGSDGRFNDMDFATIMYSPVGEEMWVASYNGPNSGYDGATDLALDALGNVYVTGLAAAGDAEDELHRADYVTIKYNDSGVEQWVSAYHHLGHDAPYAIAVDAAGNVYVTGVSSKVSGGPSDELLSDIATIKYSTHGEEMWVARYEGLSDDIVSATWSLVLDASANVYVTGYSATAGEMADYVTLKYATSGESLWVVKYNGPANNTDVARAIALDAAGNVYVTGGSFTPGSSWDYAAIKYSQQTVLAGCNDNPDKVQVCHKGKTICISKSALQAHLKHGDRLGNCGAGLAQNKQSAQQQNLAQQFGLSLYPNPASSTVNLGYTLSQDARVSVNLCDLQGRVVTAIAETENRAGFHENAFNVANLQPGLYYLKVVVKTGNSVAEQSRKIVVMQ